MTNIEKCRAAMAQGLRVQCRHASGHDKWSDGDHWEFTGADDDYRIHPEDEHKFTSPAQEKFMQIENHSTKTINGRTYTHRRGNDVCRILCTDFAGRGTHDSVVAVLDSEGYEVTYTTRTEHLKLGTDPALDVDWSQVGMDTPIWVRDFQGAKWYPRHFAGIVVGCVGTWCDGQTSHTTSTKKVWAEARLTKPE